MGVFRKNHITNDWVMFAPNRSARPHELSGGRELDQLDELLARPEYDPSCPFCPGNEKPDDRELHLQDGEDGWQVRVLENKFASVDRNLVLSASYDGLEQEMQGFGIHDVIIDTRRHNATIALLSQSEAEALMHTYRSHYQRVAAVSGIEHVVLFKNQGFKAGGSLKHPHSQVYGLPVTPFENQVRQACAQEYYDKNRSNLLGDIMKQDLESGERIVYENEDFVSWVPYAALSPYHLWIAPKRQTSSFGNSSNQELASLADMMRNTFHKSFYALRNMDFNYVFQSETHAGEENPANRWYISVIHHKKRRGGIEFAGGLFVNPMMPEVAAAQLRDVKSRPGEGGS